MAEKTPDRIRKYPVDIKAGLSDATADEVAEFLGFEGDLKSQCSEQVKRLYKMFLEVKEYIFSKSTGIYIVAPNFVLVEGHTSGGSIKGDRGQLSPPDFV